MLQIDHYDGAYGPIISLEIDSAPDLARLREIFGALAGGSAEEIELCSAMASRVVNLRELRLRLDASPGARRSLVRTARYERVASAAPRPASFVWSDSRTGWNRRAEIVESVLSNGATQRDLTREGIDGALVELSFLCAR